MLKRIAASLGAQLLTQILGFADRFILVGLLVRTWGPDLYADWVVLLAAAGLLALGELGIGIYFGNSWQYAHATGDEGRFARLVRVSISCYALIAIALTLAAAIYVLSGHQAPLVKVLPADQSSLVFLLLAGSVITNVMTGSVSQVYRGRGQFARGIMLSLTPFTLFFLIAAPAAYLDVTPLLLAMLHLACYLAGGAMMVRDIRRRFPDLVLAPTIPERFEVEDIVAHSRWNVVLQGAPVFLLQIPVVMLGAFGVGGGALVGFVMLRTLVNYSRSLASLVSLSTGVEIASLMHRGEGMRVVELSYATGKLLSGLAGALAAALLILGEDFLRLWSGRNDIFDEATMAWLIAGTVLAGSSAPVFSLFMFANKSRPAALAMLAQLALALPACALLARTHGTAGAAAGLLLGEVVAWWILVALAARRHFAINPRRYVGQSTLALLAAALWCGLILAGAKGLLGTGTPLQFVACAAIFGTLGLVPAVLTCLPTAQRSAVRQLCVQSMQRLVALRPS